jgi:hypothetical protein
MTDRTSDRGPTSATTGAPAKPAAWDALTFSQKVTWRCRNPDPGVDYRVWADKYLVKQVVRPYFDAAEPYFVTADPYRIESARLPCTYVMKATHGWSMCMLVVDRISRGGNRRLAGAGRVADSEFLRQVALAWFHSRREQQRRLWERQYQFVRPGILFERFLDPIDYELQLFLFNGRCRFAMVFYRGFHHRGATHRLYDGDWTRLPPGSAEAESCYERRAPETPPPPAELLARLAQLCGSLDQVRADFFVSGEHYYFSEFTFTHSAGEPGFIGRHDAMLGRFWLR